MSSSTSPTRPIRRRRRSTVAQLRRDRGGRPGSTPRPFASSSRSRRRSGHAQRHGRARSEAPVRGLRRRALARCAGQPAARSAPGRTASSTSSRATCVRGEINRDYHAPNRPHFDSVELKGGGDATSAARAVLQTGEYDFGWNLQVEDDVLKRMEASRQGPRRRLPERRRRDRSRSTMADPWSEVDGERSSPKSRHPILSDRAVREALTLLLDRKSMQDFVYGRAGVATPNFLNNPARFNSPNIKDEFSVDKRQRRARRRRLEARRRRRPREGRQEAQAAVPDLDQLGAPEGAEHLQAVVREGRHRARAEGR